MNPIFVGREFEQKLLNSLLDKALANSLQICFVSGERGDGKTTLVEHFAEDAQARPIKLSYALGTCQEITKGKSYEPFHDIFSQLTGLRARELQSAVGSEKEFDLKQKIQIATQTLVEITPDLIGVFVPGVSLLTKVMGVASSQIIKRRIEASKDGSISEDQLRVQSVRFFTKLTEKSPLILVFDDVQWIDQLSFNLLRHLRDSLSNSPLLIILTYRPNEISDGLKDWINEIMQDFGEVLIDLGASGQEERGYKFVEDFLQENRCHVSNEFIKEFYERTQAKPLFAAELLHYLSNSGVLTENSLGVYEENPQMKHWIEIPTRITKLKALIESRLKLINEELIEMLYIASIEGFEFTAQVIVSLTGKSERAILEALSNSLDRQYGLVKEVGEENVGSTIISRFRFANILYQEHIYNSMASGVRRIRHREVAEALEQLYGEDLEQVAVFLAEHFVRANKPRKASEYLVMLGKQQLANRQIQEGINTLERALGLARNSDYIDGVIDSQRYIGMELLGKHEHDKAEELLEEAIKSARQHQRLSALSYSLRGLGRVRRSQQRNSEAMYYYMEGLNIANQINDRGLAGACLTNIGVLASEEGRFNDAKYFYEQRLKIAEDMENDDGRIVSCINLGSTTRKMGQIEDARKYLEKGLEIVSKREDWLLECGLKISLAYVEAIEQNLNKASLLLLETLNIATTKEHRGRLLESLVCAADVLARTDHIASAAKLIGYLETTSIEKAECVRIKQFIVNRETPEDLTAIMQTAINIPLEELQNEVEQHLSRLASLNSKQPNNNFTN